MANMTLNLARNDGSSTVVHPDLGQALVTGQVNTVSVDGNITVSLPGYTPSATMD